MNEPFPIRPAAGYVVIKPIADGFGEIMAIGPPRGLAAIEGPGATPFAVGDWVYYDNPPDGRCARVTVDGRPYWLLGTHTILATRTQGRE